MKQEDIRFIIGVLAHYVMETTSVSSKCKAIEIMTKLNIKLSEELNHD